MLPPSQIRIFFWTWKQAFHSCRQPATLLPFAGYVAVQLLLLAGLFFLMYPPFSFTLLPLQKALYGEATLHYPYNFIAMPHMFEILNLILSGILGILVIGRATVLFFNNGETKPANRVVTSVSRRYFHLLGAWFVETVLVLLLMFGFDMLSGKMPDMGIYLIVIRTLCVIELGALFAFPAALILIDQQPFWTALMQSVRLSTDYALVTLLLIGLPSMLQLPLEFLLSNSDKIARKLNPEIITVVLGIGVFVTMVVNYFIVGTVTHLYRGIRHEAADTGLSAKSKSDQLKSYVR